MIASPETQATFKACSWASLCRPDVLWTTYYLSVMLIDLGVEGDFAECGVFAGTHPAMMARAIMDRVPPSQYSRYKVHLFDSFEGLPANSDQDEGIVDRLREGVICSLEQVKIYMESWKIPESLLEYHEGWFVDTLPKLKKTPLALLRIDCDMYDSVKQVLQHLYPNLVARGICIFDDYAFPGARLGFFEGTSPGTISPIMWQRR